jgi:prevent-host-death family protein
MSTTVEVRELATRLGELVELATSGAEIIVTEAGVPRARLIPLDQSKPRVLGLHPGAMKMAEDFDAPLPEEFYAVPTAARQQS